MAIEKEVLLKEEKYLKGCLKEISDNIDNLSSELDVKKTDIVENKKFAWNKN